MDTVRPGDQSRIQLTHWSRIGSGRRAALRSRRGGVELRGTGISDGGRNNHRKGGISGVKIGAQETGSVQ